MILRQVAVAAALLSVFLSQFSFGGDHHTLRFLDHSRAPQPGLCLAISPDASELALGVEPGKVHFVRLSDGEQISEITGSPFAMRYSKDNSRLLMLTTDGSFLINTKTRHRQSVDIRDEPGYIGLGPVNRNGKLLVSRLHPEGPAASTGKIAVGDEIIGYCEGKNGEWRDATGMDAESFTMAMRGPIRTHLQLRILKKGAADPETVPLTRQSATTTGDSFRFRDTQPPSIDDNLLSCLSSGRKVYVSARTGNAVASLMPIDLQMLGQHDIARDQNRAVKLAHLKSDSNKFGVEVYDLRTLERTLFAPFHRNSYSGIKFSPDGKNLFVASMEQVDVLDAETGDFRRCYRLDGTVTIDAAENLPKRNPVSEGRSSGAGPIGAAKDEAGYSGDFSQASIVSIAVSETLLAIATSNGEVSLWSLETGELKRRFSPHVYKDVYVRREGQPLLQFSDNNEWFVFYVRGVLNIVDVSEGGDAVGEVTLE